MMFSRKILGISRNLKLFAISLFFGLTGAWAILEPFISMYVTSSPDKYWFSIILLLAAIIFAIWKVYPKDSISIELQNTNMKVKIFFGDLTKQNGVIGIGVNEFFDSSIGKPVSPDSLHGYFIRKILGDKHKLFDSAVESELKALPHETIERVEGKQSKYPIGTTAKIDFGDNSYLLFALSYTNERFEAYSTPSSLLEALSGLFTKARSECNGNTLVLPLIGTGLSRSGIPSKHIIELMLIAILKASKEGEICHEVKIVLKPELIREIDLNEIKRRWK